MSASDQMGGQQVGRPHALEHNATVRPISDLGLHRADMATWPNHETHGEWLRANDRFRRDILDLLGATGPLLSRDVPVQHLDDVAVVRPTS